MPSLPPISSARLLLLTIAALTCQASAPAHAADSDGSLDTMWGDQPAQAGKAPAGQARRTSMAAAADEASGGTAALCDLEAFRQSEFVKSGGWPGVGPFHDGSTPSDYIDDSQNKIKLQTDNNKITDAQLRVTTPTANVLKLQMSADFFLESLGAKAAKIADFNAQLDKSKAQLMSRSYSNPLSLTAGRYIIAIFPEAKTSKDKLNFVIKVNSKEGAGETTAIHATPTIPATTGSGTTATTAAATGTNTNQGWDWTSVTGTGTSASATTTTTGTGTRPTTKPPTNTATTTGATRPNTTAPTPGADALKDQFRDVIAEWQKIKKVAVRQRQTSDLQQVLSGKALIKQSDAIKWLQTNKKYYDMNPLGVVVDRYTEITKGEKYAVYAQVKEASKFIDEASGQVLKDTSDTYNVNYTIEKVGDHWSINDSALLQSGPAGGKLLAKPQR